MDSTVDSRSPDDLLFAITTGGRRSSYWRVRAGAKQPELFIERENFTRHSQWHVSLHASKHWHLMNRRHEVLSWAQPAEQIPGYTRAIAIVLSVGVVHRGDVPPSDVKLVRVDEDAEPVVFSVFLERPGANLEGWPCKKTMPTAFIGRFPLAPRSPGAGTWCVVAHHDPFNIDHVKMPRPSDSELEWMKGLAEKGELFGTAIGALDDGSMAIVDVRSDGIEIPPRKAAG